MPATFSLRTLSALSTTTVTPAQSQPREVPTETIDGPYDLDTSSVNERAVALRLALDNGALAIPPLLTIVVEGGDTTAGPWQPIAKFAPSDTPYPNGSVVTNPGMTLGFVSPFRFIRARSTLDTRTPDKTSVTFQISGVKS